MESFYSMCINAYSHGFIYSVIFAVFFLLTVYSIIHALFHVRSPQGTTAWVISMLVQPLLFPLYWIVGQRKYLGYIEMLQNTFEENKDFFEERFKFIAEHRDTTIDPQWAQLNHLVWDPFLKGNEVCLYNDSVEAFPVMLDAIKSARISIFMEFFIIRSDSTGEKFFTALLDKARQGVRVYLLYDPMSSHISKKWSKLLTSAGAEVRPFRATRRRHNLFRINFRNHRKILIIDQNAIGMTGGLNIAEEYESKGPLGHWRDAFVSVKGPAVHALQTVFLADWMWATHEIIDLPQSIPVAGDFAGDNNSNPASVMVFPNGPADSCENATILFTTAIRNAKKSVRITTPYLIPDQPLLMAIKAAALCGIDVQIIIPDAPDHYVSWIAAFSFADELTAVGATVRRYTDGFIHQKLVIIDEQYVIIGTNNIDNRSLHLNFEISLVISNEALAREAIRRFNADLEKTCPSTDCRQLAFIKRLAIKIMRLFAPVL
ncbi:cardiolipin synthase [Candidatus Sumerlaeota bacterium]|nr:cardiolipin synthase [Candidatus Sumerlaeales bacterium]NLD61612.1 cardiolipin synthase [Candidatus Sumerlaeota bacterium]